MDKIVTRGLGGGKHSLVSQGFGGLFYRLKGWVTVFKKELIDWAEKLLPEKGTERLEPITLFEAQPRTVEFEAQPRVNEFSRGDVSNLFERLKMEVVGVFHTEVIREFEKISPKVTGVEKEEPIYGVDHPGTNIEVECLDRAREFDEAHEYFETPQL